MDKNIIYTLSGPDGAVRFVGMTTTGLWQRVIRYKSAMDSPGKSPVMQWIREIGYDNLNAHVVEVMPSPDGLKERTQHWIGVFARGGHDLLNVTPEQHRETVRKRLEDPAIRAKISKANKGRVRSAEARARMSAARQQFGISDEGRAKISATHTGKFVSEETRRKISEKAMGHTRNAGHVHTEEARLKMSYSKHLVIHAEAPKAGCKWCDGLTWEEAVRGLA